jgi:hypothetical protein
MSRSDALPVVAGAQPRAVVLLVVGGARLPVGDTIAVLLQLSSERRESTDRNSRLPCTVMSFCAPADDLGDLAAFRGFLMS